MDEKSSFSKWKVVHPILGLGGFVDAVTMLHAIVSQPENTDRVFWGLLRPHAVPDRFVGVDEALFGVLERLEHLEQAVFKHGPFGWRRVGVFQIPARVEYVLPDFVGEITLPNQSYQPTKAAPEKEYDMPGASLKTIRRAFFPPFNVRREGGD